MPCANLFIVEALKEKSRRGAVTQRVW